MKRFYLFAATLLAMPFLVLFCKSENPSEEVSKEDLRKMYINFTDSEIDLLGFDLVAKIKLTFADTAFENIVVERAKKCATTKTVDLLVKYFDAFEKHSGIKFSNSTSLQKEQFAEIFKREFLNADGNDRSVCDYPWLGCNGISPNCPERGNFIYYAQQNFLPAAYAYDVECNRQMGTQDCDNSYIWDDENLLLHSNPELFNFWWYCPNALYRSLMDDGISGFIHPVLGEFATFLGNKHFITANIVWSTSECPQDEFMVITRFGARKKIIVGPPSPGSIDEPKPLVATQDVIEYRRIERNR